ncbi:hypothetical protein B0O99DRAFT_707466 [Bisporella sp. PMI_857]|nr:hypothetical protein B0O99DRAFT_707466 [Bisporella sp. PMI_857]
MQLASNNGSPTKRRAGRPRIEDSSAPTDDVERLRKERIRLAQRTYRSKKDVALNNARIRAESLEKALQQIINAFTKFQKSAVASDQLPPRIALALSETSMEISSYAMQTSSENRTPNRDKFDGNTSNDGGHEAGTKESNEPIMMLNGSKATLLTSEKQNAVTSIVADKRTQHPFSGNPSSKHFPWAYNYPTETFAQLLTLACIERGFQLLSTPGMSLLDIHPALSIHLRWMSVQDLRSLVGLIIARKQLPSAHGAVPPTFAPELTQPELFRSVEGQHSMFIKRTETLDPEQLVFGRTRTLIRTGLPGFEGEWLEPRDVQEYMEDKGIFIRGEQHMDEVMIQVPQPSLKALGIQSRPDFYQQELRPTFSSQTPPNSTEQQTDGWIPGIDAELIQTSLRPPTLVSILLNLKYLIQRLSLSAVCIGPGPGVRRSDVDQALRFAVRPIHEI